MEKKKIVSIEDRIPKLKEARKKKANRRLLFYLTIFFVLISIIIYLQSPLSHIKEIEVQDNYFLSDEQVVSVSGLALGTNIWMLNKNSVQKKMENHPVIDSAQVKRKLPFTIELDINEHQVVGFLKEEESTYYPVLESGMIISNSDIVYDGDNPLLTNFDDDDYLTRMTIELGDLPVEILNLISEITWEPTEKNKHKIVLYMNDGYVVESTMRDFATKMKSYPSIVSQLDGEDKGIIHMGVGTYFEKIDE
ncbi:MAG TPA: FtsQ-type POTRA domain-containing protein [Pseudogracilibacillus sp.]|nr:FtsQ-type POTRA domain-containing protein [Pseudogracilibacillus sp.]